MFSWQGGKADSKTREVVGGVVWGAVLDEVVEAEEEDEQRWVQTTMMKAHMGMIWRWVWHFVLDAYCVLLLQSKFRILDNIYPTPSSPNLKCGALHDQLVQHFSNRPICPECRQCKHVSLTKVVQCCLRLHKTSLTERTSMLHQPPFCTVLLNCLVESSCTEHQKKKFRQLWSAWLPHCCLQLCLVCTIQHAVH